MMARKLLNLLQYIISINLRIYKVYNIICKDFTFLKKKRKCTCNAEQRDKKSTLLFVLEISLDKKKAIPNIIFKCGQNIAVAMHISTEKHKTVKIIVLYRAKKWLLSTP